MNTEKILLVDDERAIRLAVRTALTREGMQVTEAADGSEALELLKKQQFPWELRRYRCSHKKQHGFLSVCHENRCMSPGKDTFLE